jgi:hypothetical protein
VRVTKIKRKTVERIAGTKIGYFYTKKGRKQEKT